jgi:phosphoribosylformylglycinamidine synthase I
MKVGIVVFPGSNCDYDCYSAVKLLGVQDVSYVWHKEVNPGTFDAYVLPGGFSYGDYLRCGAIARFSPVLAAVREHVAGGRLVIGICNGFQILCEAGLLPGALYMNNSLNFICEHLYIKNERTDTPFTTRCEKGQVLNIPIAHGEGHYFADDDTIKLLEDTGRIAFRYCTRDGEVSPEANPNGSRNNIAGIYNEAGTVLGMMPHPERAADEILGSSDGRYILESLISSIS